MVLLVARLLPLECRHTTFRRSAKAVDLSCAHACLTAIGPDSSRIQRRRAVLPITEFSMVVHLLVVATNSCIGCGRSNAWSTCVIKFGYSSRCNVEVLSLYLPTVNESPAVTCEWNVLGAATAHASESKSERRSLAVTNGQLCGGRSEPE